MNYPAITHIDEVTPYIEGYAISKIVYQDVILLNYAYAYPELFAIDPDNPIAGHMRRECRGIAFDKNTGKVVSRPFHKFFNVGEKEETDPSKLDFSNPHMIYNKRDGSMIRPVRMHGSKYGFLFMTRGGYSEVADQAMRHFEKTYTKERHDFIMYSIDADVTVMFEWEDVNRTIVIKHDKSDIVFIGARVNQSGKYITDLYKKEDVPFTYTEVYDTVEDKTAYFNSVRDVVGREGDVIYFPNDNTLYKVKGDHYRNLHWFVSGDVKGRHVLDMVLKQTFDDFITQVEDRMSVERFEYYNATLSEYIKNSIDLAVRTCDNLEVEKDAYKIINQTFKYEPRLMKPAMRYHRSKDKSQLVLDVFYQLCHYTFDDKRYEEFIKQNGLDLPNRIF